MITSLTWEYDVPQAKNTSHQILCQVLYVLTLVTTLIMPTHLLTGIFGMNWQDAAPQLTSWASWAGPGVICSRRGWEASGTWTWSHGGKSRILPLLGLPGSRFRLGSGSRIPWSRLKVWHNSDAQVLRSAWRCWFGWLFREFWNGFDHLIIRSRGPRSECRTWDLCFFFQTVGGSMVFSNHMHCLVAGPVFCPVYGGLTGQTVARFHKVWWASC